MLIYVLKIGSLSLSLSVFASFSLCLCLSLSFTGNLRKAPPPPASQARPPPPQSKPPPLKPKEAESATQGKIGSEYTALITSSVNGREVQENEYVVPSPQAPVPVAEYTEPISSKTVSKSSLPPG